MLITFFIDYHTTPNENIYLSLQGNLDFYMQPVGAETHMAVVNTGEHPSLKDAPLAFDYCFEVRRNDGSIRKEWGQPHHLDIDSELESLQIYDHWHDRPAHNELSSVFVSRILNRRPLSESASIMPSQLCFEVSAPGLASDKNLMLVGDLPALGSWNPHNAVPMSTTDNITFRASVPLPAAGTPLSYKFITVDSNHSESVEWESGNNRSFLIPPHTGNESIAIKGLTLQLQPSAVRAAGTVIPVFSLRSNHSFGIGDFGDLRLMTEWIHKTGQNLLQILPVNDTTMTGTWTDSYPYNAISTFALHPVYLRLKRPDYNPALAKKFDAARKKLNALPQIDYEKAFHAKMQFARFDFDHEGTAVLASEAYHRFIDDNAYWLDNYTAFSLLRDKYSTPDFTKWDEYATYNPAAIAALLENNAAEADFYRYLQFRLHKQLKEASDRAEALGVALKGDIPIGISRNSVDAWTNPELFLLDKCAGAPPDDFAVNGQNWGFPTYNWDRMALDNYKWWNNRFTKMAVYFHAYRIDHILGFFRIWQVPASQLYGTLGTFYPALPLSPREMLQRFGFRLLPSHVLQEKPTQREILTKFARRPKTKANQFAQHVELEQVADILFIEDSQQQGLYHPRIDGHKTKLFASLSPDQQDAYRQLSEDFFYHRHNDFWRNSAMKKLPSLTSSTSMLCCGEDLGMIPACVAPVMNNLSILSLEVQRMPKQFGVEFAIPATYPYLSVATTSTHDMPGLRQWLNDDSARAARFFEAMNINGDNTNPDSPESCREVISAHLNSPAMLTVLPWQDWMSINPDLRHPNPEDELINNPACSNHYWRYRMHLTVEQLLQADDFNESIRSLIKASGRYLPDKL